MYPLFLYIGIPATGVLFLLFHLIRKKKTVFDGGTRAANAQFTKELPEYRSRQALTRLLAVLMELFLIAGIISALVLCARPYKTETVTSGTRKRDIFLCMDVSYSIYALNYDLVENLKEVVGGLRGDRFGICIFNTSTVLYVPMTDDYDFVTTKLDDIKEYFRLQADYMEYVDEWGYINVPESDYDTWEELREKLDYYDAGTLIQNYQKGSSLIGEGLVSCLYSFPSLDDEDRTRVIIMATDNAEEAQAKPLVELDEAARLCKKNKVTVFGIFPDRETFSLVNDQDYETERNEMKKDIELTGGKFYEQSKSLTVSDIVADIQEQEAMEVDEITTTRTVDQPKAAAIVLLISVLGALLTGLLLRR